MQRNRKKLLTVIAVLGMALIPVAANAAGGGEASAPTTSTPELTPKQMAANSYNMGVRHIKKADGLAVEAGAQQDAKKRAKLEAKSRKGYEKAIRANQDAIKFFPGMFEAHSNLGYAYRKTRAYEEGLVAYDKALELEPRYTPAIEYRAEAFLGLNRLEEAKSAYMDLFRSDRPRADELGAAMQEWVESHRSEPGGVAPEVVEEFVNWLSQRREVAQQTSALTTQPDKSSW